MKNNILMLLAAMMILMVLFTGAFAEDPPVYRVFYMVTAADNLNYQIIMQ